MNKPLIKLIRELLKLSIIEVAEITNNSIQNVTLIDDGIVKADNRIIREYADRLGINPFTLKTVIYYDGDSLLKLIIISILKKYLKLVIYLNN